MRYYLLGFLVAVLVAVSVAGFRGSVSKKPPIEIFPDMDRQLKYKYQKPSDFYADGRAARPPVEGTVPMGFKIPAKAGGLTGQDLLAAIKSPYGYFSRGKDYIDTGEMNGEWGTGLPFEVTLAVLERGRDRYNINCAVCHGELGEGNGPVSKYNYSPPIANFHQDLFRNMPDGQIFHTISKGKGVPGQWTMYPYEEKITVEDRWAIVAYVRALQRSTKGTLEDVPQADREALEAK